MTEDFDEIENALRRWRPREASEDLGRRVARELERPPLPPKRWWQALGFNNPFAACGWGLAVPAVVALTTLLALPSPSAITPVQAQPVETPAAASSWRAAGATNRRLETNDDGVVLDAAQRPVRRTRYRSEDTVAWRNPETGAILEVSYPREDVVTIPVTMR